MSSRASRTAAMIAAAIAASLGVGTLYCGVRLQMPNLERQASIFFLNQFRSARLTALADAESFDQIIHAVERLGSHLNGKLTDLGNYKEPLMRLAENSGLAALPCEFRSLLTPFSELYELVRIARNDALHQGASARHLTKHAVELAIILEDALSSQLNPTVADFMIRNPTCAELWQPLGFIRQQMLSNSYSFLPVLGEGRIWQVISDASLARFLGSERDGSTRKSQLAKTLRDAYREASDILEPATVVAADASLSLALENLKSKSVLLVGHSAQEAVYGCDDILGILTAFDLL